MLWKLARRNHVCSGHFLYFQDFKSSKTRLDTHQPDPSSSSECLGSSWIPWIPRYWTLINPIWDLVPVELSGLWAHFLNWLCLLISPLDPRVILDGMKYRGILRHTETTAHSTVIRMACSPYAETVSQPFLGLEGSEQQQSDGDKSWIDVDQLLIWGINNP